LAALGQPTPKTFLLYSTQVPRLETLERAGFHKDVVRLPKSTTALPSPSPERRHRPLFGRRCLPGPTLLPADNRHRPHPGASPSYCPAPGTGPDLDASLRCCPTPPGTPAAAVAAPDSASRRHPSPPPTLLPGALHYRKLYLPTSVLLLPELHL
jgi:hypothetical protein